MQQKTGIANMLALFRISCFLKLKICGVSLYRALNKIIRQQLGTKNNKEAFPLVKYLTKRLELIKATFYVEERY